jgi:hypothetical protein
MKFVLFEIWPCTGMSVERWVERPGIQPRGTEIAFASIAGVVAGDAPNVGPKCD